MLPLSPLAARQWSRAYRSCYSSLISAGRSRNFSASPCRSDTYGFIGLGAMGYPMALNLAKKLNKDDSVLVYDVNASSTSKFAEEAASMSIDSSVEVASSAREAAERANTIITVLPEPTHVQSVFKGILASKLPQLSSASKRLYIDCSTIDPMTSTSVAASIRSLHPEDTFVDAPMSGGTVGARAGSLTFMVGCPEEALEQTQNILKLMGKRVFRLGEQGTGLVGKLANNYLLAISNIATCEAMNLGTKLGLDAKALAELINSSSGRCWSSEVNNPVAGISPGAPAERGYAGGFGVPLMKKDLRLAMSAAKEKEVKLLLGERAKEIYQEVEDAEGGKDFSVIYKFLEQQSRGGSVWHYKS